VTNLLHSTVGQMERDEQDDLRKLVVGKDAVVKRHLTCADSPNDFKGPRDRASERLFLRYQENVDA
jgi:hypothetical protein